MNDSDVPKLLLGKDSVTIHGGGPISEWVLVPKHPTMEMLRAAWHACDGLNLSKLNRVDKSLYKAARRWEAMLRVAAELVSASSSTTGANE